eukprot:10685927-Heterocapsa_arctica.AAC.1
MGQHRRPRWEDEQGNVIWSPCRIQITKYLESQIFESAMGAIICLNIILIIIEVDKEADCYALNPD